MRAHSKCTPAAVKKKIKDIGYWDFNFQFIFFGGKGGVQDGAMALWDKGHLCTFRLAAKLGNLFKTFRWMFGCLS